MNEPTEESYYKFIAKLGSAIGVSEMAAATLITQTLESCIPIKKEPTTDWGLISALVCEFNPQSPQEALLAIQMISVHYQIMGLFSKSVRCDFPTASDEYLALATKMTKLYASQMELWNKWMRSLIKNMKNNYSALEI